MKAILSIFALIFSLYSHSSELSFPAQENCVAWKAKKVMFLVSTKWPVGMNCKVKLLDRSEGAERRFVVQVPLTSFRSGEAERDSVVAELLGAPEHSELVLDTGELSSERYDQLREGSLKTLDVSMILMSVRYPLSVKTEVVAKDEEGDRYLTGSYIGKLSDFAIEVPSVAGGLVASPRDYLELHFQIKLP